MKIDTHFFDQKTVLVFGKEGTGLGAVHFLVTTDAKSIIITDQASPEDLQPIVQGAPADSRLEWHLGEERVEDFLKANIIVKSPSIAWDHPFLIQAQQNGAEVVMDSTIFMSLVSVPVLGVTGSKGKTTTATLLAHILDTAGYQVVPVGISRIGVLSELSKIKEDSVVVFEFSSWRLSGLLAIEKSPAVSIITNLYPDHLNYYGTMEDYAKDKKIITQFQKPGDTLVVPHSNHWTKYFAEGTQARVMEFGNEKEQAAWQDDRALYLHTEEGDVEIFQKEKSGWQGDHIFENFLAASLGAYSFGVSIATIIDSLKTFTGVPHRFQLVRELGGVRYINDTTATIPTAALSSASSIPGEVILLAGGSDKGLPLENLARAVERAKFAVLFRGSGTDILLPLLREKKISHYQIVESMQQAVTVAQAQAKPGDTVLLAPGAASFGMFKNEFDRGEQFVKEVNQL